MSNGDEFLKSEGEKLKDLGQSLQELNESFVKLGKLKKRLRVLRWRLVESIMELLVVVVFSISAFLTKGKEGWIYIGFAVILASVFQLKHELLKIKDKLESEE